MHNFAKAYAERGEAPLTLNLSLKPTPFTLTFSLPLTPNP